MIPDAPWIREAEVRGTDYSYEFIYGNCYEYEDDYSYDGFEEDEEC